MIKSTLQLVLAILLLNSVYGSDREKIYVAEPKKWSNEAESALVNLISSNGDAQSVYAKVVKRLRRSGVPVAYVWKVFTDSAVVIDENIVQRFARPAERMDYSEYRQIFVNEDRIELGVIFYQKHRELLDQVAVQYGVDPYLILSFVGVETRYGEYDSAYPVFNALHTIIHTMPRRAKWVEDEMVAWFMICRMDGLNPLSVKGSYAGAFGYGQFMPTSFKSYAVDMDGDGIREPYEWADVFASIANYLLKRGKYSTASQDFSESSRNWRAVYKYNPSKNYVRVVLELRTELQQAIKKS